MNAPARPNFGAIPLGPLASKKDIDKLASAAKTYAQRDNIPMLTHPNEVKPAGEGSTARAEAQPASTSSKTFERFTVEVPGYLYDDICKRISTTKQTKKSVVLNAFHKAGFYVAAEDLVEDGRRGK
jgi:hypothetical protein